MSLSIVTNPFLAYAGILIVLTVSTIVTLSPRQLLEVSVRESIIAIIGDDGLNEARKAMQATMNKTDITIPQKRMLQAMIALAGIPMTVMLLFFTKPLFALLGGGLVAILGFLYPLSAWQGTVRKSIAEGVWKDVPDLVSFLRLNVGAGKGVKEILDSYVTDSPKESGLAKELQYVLALAEGGANLFDQFELSARRFPDGSLLQVAVSLRQVEEADDPQSVLKSLYELIRSVRVAERKKQIKGRVMTSIVFGVMFLLPALMALILVPAVVSFGSLLGG